MELLYLPFDHPACYRVCAQGVFDAYSLELLSGVWVITHSSVARNGVITLVGQVADQAALLGTLEQIYSLGLPILSVEHLANDADLSR